MRHVDTVLPIQSGRFGRRSIGLRINHYINFIRLQHAIWGALSVITTAVVIKDRNRLGWTLLVTNANLQSVRSRIVLLDQGLDSVKLGQVDAVLLSYKNVM